MCITSKESSLAFAALLGVSVLLYIRNNEYDRIIAALFIVISMIQLVELLYHTHNISSDNGGRMLYLILLLQTFVLAIGLYYHYRTTFTKVWVGLYSVLFFGGLLYSLNTSFSVSQEHGHLVWSRRNSDRATILGDIGWLYLLGLFGPFFVIQYYNNWKNAGIWILLIVLTLSAIVVRIVYPKVCFSSMWCYSSIAVAFTAWLIGAFDEHKHRS